VSWTFGRVDSDAFAVNTALSLDMVIEVAYALGIGVFIGLEREHHGIAAGLDAHEAPAEHGVSAGPPDTSMGLRTFALLSVMGWAVAYAGDAWPWVPPVGLAVAAALVIAQYVIAREQGTGVTTETAAVLTFVLGMLVHVQRPIAVSLAVVTALLLVAKDWIRAAVVKLRRVEISGTVQLLVLLAIVLPLLPADASDPWGALPPRKIGLFVILIAGISYVGYVASRVLGERRGAGLTGLLGGLTSSTAVTVAMSKAGRDEPMRRPGQMAVFLANAVMFFRVIVIAAVLSRAVATRLMWPLGAMGLVMLVGALWAWRVSVREPDSPGDSGGVGELSNPFALMPAIKWGVVLTAVLFIAAVAKDYLGDRGVLLASAASGLADVDAITLAVSRQAGDAVLGESIAVLAITIAVISNTVVKGGLAVGGGGRRFGAPIALGFLIAIAVGAGVALAVGGVA
jgi:uncharacterized membrane protein (DUF4010 family)